MSMFIPCNKERFNGKNFYCLFSKLFNFGLKCKVIMYTCNQYLHLKILLKNFNHKQVALE